MKLYCTFFCLLILKCPQLSVGVCQSIFEMTVGHKERRKVMRNPLLRFVEHVWGRLFEYVPETTCHTDCNELSGNVVRYFQMCFVVYTVSWKVVIRTGCYMKKTCRYLMPLPKTFIYSLVFLRTSGIWQRHWTNTVNEMTEGQKNCCRCDPLQLSAL